MKAAIAAVAFVLFLFGCASIPHGPIDCRNDSGCIMQALRNGCQDAHMENMRARSGYTFGTADLRVSVANLNTSCRVQAVWTDASNNTLNTVGADFKLPLAGCQTDIPDSYMTVDGKCVGIGIQ